jgi:hypothetical protein
LFPDWWVGLGYSQGSTNRRERFETISQSEIARRASAVMHEFNLPG